MNLTRQINRAITEIKDFWKWCESSLWDDENIGKPVESVQKTDSEKRTTAEKNKPHPPSFIVSVKPCSSFDSEPAPSHQIHIANHGKDSKPWKDKLELGGFFVAIIVAICVIVQSCETIKTTRSTAQQVVEMQKDRNLDERAWVFITGEVHETISNDRNSAFFELMYKNSGKTPALNVQDIVSWTEDGAHIANVDDYPSVPNHQGLWGPQAEGRIQTATIPKQYFTDIANGIPCFIYGTIWYDDIFGSHHWSQFCMKVSRSPVDANVILYSAFPIHNSCDDAQPYHQK